MTIEKAFDLMQETINSLHRSGVVVDQLSVSPETVLLGTGSQLDSIGFVTFITELEDRVARESGKETYLVLDEIQKFSVNNPHLSADILAQYLSSITSAGNA